MSDHVVELKPRPRGLVTVKFAGGRFFTIPLDQAQGLEIGTVVRDDEVDRLDRVDQYFRGKGKALRLLSKRARTRKEIKSALDNLSIESSIRDGILSELAETGLIDDRRFAREYVRLKAEVRDFGPHRLRHDLKKLGVSPSIVDDAVDEAFDTDVQEEAARRVARKRAAGSPVDEKTARRIAGVLRRKGYDYEVINRVLYDFLHDRDRDPDAFL
jgi:regulatory protein